MTNSFRVLTTFVLTVLASVSLFAISVHAASAEELNARWYTTKDYPATPDDKEWRLHDFSEWIDILNPPEDLLKEFTSEELAKLLLRYPYLINYGCYDEEWMFFDFMGQSAIYEELFRREDGIHEMLIAFQDNEIDYELLDKEPLAVYGRDLGALADQFVCQYMRFHWEFIPDEEKLLYIEIAEKKKLNYAELKEEEPEKYLCGLLLFFEKENYSKPNEIVSARYDSMLRARTAEYFLSNGNVHTQEMLGVVTNYYLGDYYKHGTYAPCREWYTCDFSDEQKQEINNNHARSYPLWTYVYTATTKYNCHSYAWISWNPSNKYWLPSPANYYGGSSYYCVGTYTSERLDLLENDRVVIYSASGELNHSMIVVDPNYHGTMITESKNGYKGVYRAKYSDMMRFYRGAYYKVFRQY